MGFLCSVVYRVLSACERKVLKARQRFFMGVPSTLGGRAVNTTLSSRFMFSAGAGGNKLHSIRLTCSSPIGFLPSRHQGS